MKYSISRSDAGSQRCAMAIVGIHAGRRLSPSAELLEQTTGGQLSRAMAGGAFDGKPGQSLTVHAPAKGPASKILLVGLGRKGTLSATQFVAAASAAMRTAVANNVANLACFLEEAPVKDRDTAWQLAQSATAAMEATYRYTQTKSAPDAPPALRQVRFGLPEGMKPDAALAAVKQGEAVGQGLALAKELGNLPGNICTPTYLGERAMEVAKGTRGLRAKVLSTPELRRLGMGSFLSVAAGSNQAPKLIVLEYRGGPRGQAPTALVGKGVTFDTGGISLKPGAAMDEMKFDMCGAASVFGAMLAAARMSLAVNIVGIIPATENMPGGKATKPGDVVTAMDGQTIEILNTDAEGRLILCDALVYAKRFEPESIVDIATLTGACVIALGSPASGLFSNDQPMANALLAAGETACDRAWQMPVWDEYDEMLKSNFADVANIGGREAGAVTAACFLARFAKDQKWAHLDIAGTAWNKGKEKGSSGRPVKLLVEYLRGRVRSGR